MNVAIDDSDFLLRPELVGRAQTIGEAKYFSPPTPGEINGEGTEAPSGPVEYSVSTRTFVSDFDVAITTASPDAVIRYTTDGTLPDEDSTEYNGPIRVTTSTRLRARAFEPGKGPGPVKSEGYIELASSVSRFEGNTPFESNLPLMVFNSFDRTVTSQDTNMVPVTGGLYRARRRWSREHLGRRRVRRTGRYANSWPNVSRLSQETVRTRALGRIQQ